MYALLPDQTFHNLGASKSVGPRILYSPESSIVDHRNCELLSRDRSYSFARGLLPLSPTVVFVPDVRAGTFLERKEKKEGILFGMKEIEKSVEARLDFPANCYLHTLKNVYLSFLFHNFTFS